MSSSSITPPWLRDVGLMAALLVPVLVGSTQIEPDVNERAIDLAGYACGLVGSLSLLLRRRWPVAMVLVASAAVAFYVARGYLGGPVFLTGAVSLFAFGLARPRRQAYWAAASMVAVIAVAGALSDAWGPGAWYLILVGWAAAAVLAADVVRGRVERVSAERERRRAQAGRTVAEERLRLAQDLHDGVAHALSVIAIQSRVGSRAAETPEARDALDVITRTTTTALSDLNGMVQVLRDVAPAPRHPVGSIDQVDDLVDQARASGQLVELTAGRVGELPGAVGGAAYRVVQEALTNARRHARGAPVHVDVAGGDESLVVRVRNGTAPSARNTGAGRDLTTPGERGSGLGLVGMRERVQATGGTLQAGATKDGGWEVLARWRSRSGS